MKDSIKNKIKSYSFWVSLASAILLLIQTIGRPLGLLIDESMYMSIVNSVLGVFVVLGIVSHPSQNLIKDSTSKTEENGDENAEKQAKTSSKEEKSDSKDKTQSNVMQGGGVVIDSKSGCDASKTDVNADAYCVLDNESKQKIQKAKQDFINSCSE